MSEFWCFSCSGWVDPSERHPHVVCDWWCAFLVTRNRPRCPICAGQMKKNSTTSKGSTRWWCKDPSCGTSTTRTRADLTQARDPKASHSYVTCTAIRALEAPRAHVDTTTTHEPASVPTAEQPNSESAQRGFTAKVNRRSRARILPAARCVGAVAAGALQADQFNAT